MLKYNLIKRNQDDQQQCQQQKTDHDQSNQENVIKIKMSIVKLTKIKIIMKAIKI